MPFCAFFLVCYAVMVHCSGCIEPLKSTFAICHIFLHPFFLPFFSFSTIIHRTGKSKGPLSLNELLPTLFLLQHLHHHYDHHPLSSIFAFHSTPTATHHTHKHTTTQSHLTHLPSPFFNCHCLPLLRLTLRQQQTLSTSPLQSSSSCSSLFTPLPPLLSLGVHGKFVSQP